MSNETDLDWLARNVHEWPAKSLGRVTVHGAQFTPYQDGEDEYTCDWAYKYMLYPESQWLARRAELQNKPSWKDAPEWANYLAIDGDSVWYWHEMDPKTVAGCEYWMSRGQSGIACRGELLGDWRDTLEKRPEEFKQFTSIEDNQELSVSQGYEIKQDNGWFERGELPPVGSQCEVMHRDSWVVCGVIAHFQQKAAMVAAYTVDNGNALKSLDSCIAKYFRPIPTERDVLADLIESHGQMSALIVADAIIAAGFKLEAK